ncbi:MAG: ribonuclease R [Magnetovibrio sp.]|nr:ribonuclease R [Magnetovibrio sp.]
MIVPKTPSPFPTRESILDFIQESPHDVGKREIARAFGLNTEQKRTLKKILRELLLDGSLRKSRGKRFGNESRLPQVVIVEISGKDNNGFLNAIPVNWDNEAPPPPIVILPNYRQKPKLGKGDRILVRVTKKKDGYQAKTIRRISESPVHFLGILTEGNNGLRIKSTDRRDRYEFIVEANNTMEAQSGMLVRAEILPGKYRGLRYARVIETLNSMGDGYNFSIIAIHQHNIPHIFPPEVERELKRASPTDVNGREDLRHIPLITIDGADARDFDDAVWAEPDPKHAGGWHCIVAIADVASYVPIDSAIDKEAQTRGNSVYFPDQVIPMLPEALSNDLCSLKPNQERLCIAAHLWINANGTLRSHKFTRSIIRSAARLTYNQVQSAYDGNLDPATQPLLNNVIKPLYHVYHCLAKARSKRHALELNLSEYKIILNQDGHVKHIEKNQQFDSHKLIEELMITANVAAAETLEKHKLPCIYRIHDQPAAEKIDTFIEFLASFNVRFSKGQVIKPIQFNQILTQVRKSPHRDVITEAILRTQAQAQYCPKNIGHFGLSLNKYCHFTSPIRRYSDLLVHRLLIDSLHLGTRKTTYNPANLTNVAKHISETERRASVAERESIDRYTAQHMTHHVGKTFAAKISGVTRAGIFINLDTTGANGFVPMRNLPHDYFEHDAILHTLQGRRTGLEFHLGQRVDVLLTEVVPLTGSMIFNILDAGVGSTYKPNQTRKRANKKR